MVRVSQKIGEVAGYGVYLSCSQLISYEHINKNLPAGSYKIYLRSQSCKRENLAR
jgi:hypothetical protein